MSNPFFKKLQQDLLLDAWARIQQDYTCSNVDNEVLSVGHTPLLFSPTGVQAVPLKVHMQFCSEPTFRPV